MIARIWRGTVRRRDGDEYADYIRETGLAAYAATPGNRGVWVLRRDVDDGTEFVMLTFWDSLDAVKAFAGEDFEAAVFYPEDDRFLIERDTRASHFAVDQGETHSDDRPRLEGKQVILRPLGLDDIERILEILSEPGVARWWGRPNEAELVRQASALSEDRALAIEERGDLVGLIQYYEEDDPDYRYAAIDILLTERAQRRGLGPDAIRTLARYLFGERGHHRLTIDPSADNAYAIRAYEKVGFRRVGVMREYWRTPEGDWRNGLLMDLLASELRP